MQKEKAGKRKKAGALLFWLLLWQLAAFWTDNPLILVGPAEAFTALIRQAGEFSFWQAIAFSAGRIGAGFLLAFTAGFLAGGLASRFFFVRELLALPLLLMKAAPVASLVILILIWLGVEGLTRAITFLVVFPVIYQATLTGLASADAELLEMARVFRLSRWKRYLYIYRPAVYPSLRGSARTAIGMSWKAGVAAEVIGIPDFSIGAKLYMAKIYFDTAELFAWTAVIIFLSLCFEKFFLWILNWLDRPFGGWLTGEPPVFSKPKTEASRNIVRVRGLCKSFSGEPVLDHLDLTWEAGKTYGLTAPSGTGKTTLFRILTGLEKADEGQVEIGSGVGNASGKGWSVVFQEDRLCPELTAEENAQIAGGRAYLSEILPEESLSKKAGELSGGMRRRVAIARAMAADSEGILMDEPFSGLDEAAKENVMHYIKKHQRGRTLIFTTHVREEFARMEVCRVDEI
ncbi:MAG: ATP-binding cassette domain-containing protein [Lachnospiraceae bacterium]|nr:ATP-binding cassette domain-containing protein [Lachnospiraceae bacterium]